MNLEGLCKLAGGASVTIHKHDSATGRRYHAAFDVWDENGNHLGSYTFAGVQVAPADASKNITERLEGLSRVR